MKNLIKVIILTIIWWIISTWKSFAIETFPYSWIDIWVNQNTDFASDLKEDIADSSNWFNKLFHLFMPNSDMYWSDTSPSFLFYLKTIVNLLLSFVSLIALILMIYAFYMIFFKKDEAGTTTARQMIKWIVIALVVIWLSWIVVSFLFRFEKENTQDIWYNNNTEVVSSLT